MESALQEELKELQCLKDLAEAYGESEDGKWFKARLKALKQKFMKQGREIVKKEGKTDKPEPPKDLGWTTVATLNVKEFDKAYPMIGKHLPGDFVPDAFTRGGKVNFQGEMYCDWRRRMTKDAKVFARLIKYKGKIILQKGIPGGAAPEAEDEEKEGENEEDKDDDDAGDGAGGGKTTAPAPAQEAQAKEPKKKKAPEAGASADAPKPKRSRRSAM